jgi:hypothetical protein
MATGCASARPRRLGQIRARAGHRHIDYMVPNRYLIIQGDWSIREHNAITRA